MKSEKVETRITPKKIREWRKSKGWSQVEAGRRMGISWLTVLRWEKGHQKPKGVYLVILRTFMWKWLDKLPNRR